MFAPKDQDNGRAGARGLTRHHQGTLTCGLRRAAAGAVLAAVTLPLFGAAAVQAVTTTPAFTQLKLVNGWANYGNGTARAAVASINGIVYLKVGSRPAAPTRCPSPCQRATVRPTGSTFRSICAGAATGGWTSCPPAR